MKLIFLISIISLLVSCSKPKSVFICGDHECVNKSEAEHFFEENLSIEVKFLDKKKNKNINLIELNLIENSKESKSIAIFEKKNSKQDIKVLSGKEIKEIKKNIKYKKSKRKKIVKANKTRKKEDKVTSYVDVCTIIENCNITEISKYLLKQGKKRKLPDITTRQN